MSLTTTAIDPLHFRKALGHFASGLTVITSHIDDEPIGFPCQSFYSVSTAPPLVSFSVKRDSFSYPKIRRAGRFAVNILSDEQAAVSNLFAQQGADKWKETDWATSPLGNPVIGGSLHWLDCDIHAEYEAGDHLIVIGEVRALSLQPTTTTQPLLYFKGQYCNLDASVTT